MPESIKYLIDAAVGFALFLALLLVFIVDRVFLASSDDVLPENTLQAIATEDKTKHRDLKRLKLAVTPTGEFKNFVSKTTDKWDDMGKLLDGLGDGYRYDKITMQDATNLKKLREYDVVFLTCASGSEDELREVLPAYVSEGGILYASDWRFEAIAKAFPEMVAPKLVGEGAEQNLSAEIVDPALRDLLGPTIALKFDLPEWKTAAFSGRRVHTLMQGKYRKHQSNVVATAPLMVRFELGKGTVVFTSFHNEKQNSRTEKQLLEYLVYSLVTAGVDAEVNTQMNDGGFAPQRSNLLSTPAKATTDPKTYKNARVGTLRFVLGFRNEGAKLRLNITSPDGKKFSQNCESTLIVDVPDAAVGEWTYTVTAVNLPYANFPFRVSVGEKK